ncbi:MAG: aminoacyl-histidine dipeptidase [Eubacterium sp.]|nr:aminoacyl-histidine dipeptidase [Eubacterium sp.]
MNVLTGVEPVNVFKHFETICNIPHGSKNTKRISDHLVDFAKEHDLKYIQDEYNNVIIFKNGQKGGENSETIILQGHIDMVCEKEADSDIDLEKSGLKLILEDGILSADGTTLGGDDGIAVAYMMAILESDDIPHPPLECTFTVDEEIGMIGAMGMDMSVLKGRKLLNIDSEEEGHLLVSCAGGAAVNLKFPILRRGAQGKTYKLVVSGLQGGHSGVDINSGRASADILMTALLKDMLLADDTLRLIGMKGGFKDNAIPVRAEAVICSNNAAVLNPVIQEFLDNAKASYKSTEPGLKIEFEEVDKKDTEYADLYPIDELNNLNLIMALGDLPFGVKKMSENIEGLVQTSLNLGIINTTADEIVMTYSVRSSVNSERQELIDDLGLLAKSVGGSSSVYGIYPAWEYNQDSELREIITSTYEEMYGEPMIVEALHAGLECGIFCDKIKDLDAVSFGPDIFDIHTTRERIPVESVERVWKYILLLLSNMCK